jgi:hypothetical protein
MCYKITFSHQNGERQIAFASPNAKLPVLTKSGKLCLLAWGRRKCQPGNLPLGGLALLDSIQAGQWDAYFPKPVKLPIKSFMVRDMEDKERWFHLPSDKWIQGLLARDDRECRIYVVALAPEDQEYLCWPRILHG